MNSLVTQHSTSRFRPKLEALEDRSVPSSAGLIDPTFGTDGIVTTRVSDNTTILNAVALGDDGKIAVVGYSFSNAGLTTFVGQYDVNGSLDSSFGNNGVLTKFNNQWFRDVVVQPDGKIIAAGTGYSSNSPGDFLLVRFNSNGSLDNSFGNKGKVQTDITSQSAEGATRLLLQADGKILVAGATTPNGASYTTIRDLALVRYNSNGSLDTTFGNGGKSTIRFDQPFTISSHNSVNLNTHNMDMALDPVTGKIVVVGHLGDSSSSLGVVSRINADGTLDTTFGDGTGYVTLRKSSSIDVVVQSDSRIIITNTLIGTSPTRSAMVRLDSNGSVDETFGIDGYVVDVSNAFGASQTLMVQPDGKIVAAVKRSLRAGYNDYELVVARYDVDGTLDSSFGTDGIAVSGIKTVDPFAVGLALDSAGRIIAATTSQSQIGLVRFLGDDGLPAPTVSIADAAFNVVNGVGGTMTFTVTLSHGFHDGMTISYSTADNTALAGTHYTAVSSYVTFQPGQTTATIEVPISNRTESASRMFWLILTDTDDNVLSTAIGTINYTTTGGGKGGGKK